MYTYLLVDLFSVLVPFLFTFHPKVKFHQQWFAFIPAWLVSALLFCIWDSSFTRWKVWGFNPNFITGIRISNLPLEEILFFLCIPYACVFSYWVLPDWPVFRRRLNRWIVILPAVLLIAIGVYYGSRLYTSTTFIFFGSFLLFLQALRAPFLFRFFICYAILLVPFFIVNGILTGSFIGREVVWYNNDHNLGLRILTIPVEDIFYGALLFLMNVAGFEWLRNRKVNI